MPLDTPKLAPESSVHTQQNGIDGTEMLKLRTHAVHAAHMQHQDASAEYCNCEDAVCDMPA